MFIDSQKAFSQFQVEPSDVWPLTAVHDAIARTIRQCQRIILILSTEEEFGTDGTGEGDLLCDQSQLRYEQSISLYDALLLNDPKVILVEIGEQTLLKYYCSSGSSTCIIGFVLPCQVRWITAACQNLCATSGENKDLSHGEKPLLEPPASEKCI